MDPMKAAMMQALMKAQGGQGGPPGMPPGMPQGGPPPGMQPGMPPGMMPPGMPGMQPGMPPGAMPGMPGPGMPPPPPPPSMPGQQDKIAGGLAQMADLGQQILQDMDPADERTDRLSSILQELQQILGMQKGGPVSAGGRSPVQDIGVPAPNQEGPPPSMPPGM